MNKTGFLQIVLLVALLATPVTRAHGRQPDTLLSSLPASWTDQPASAVAPIAGGSPAAPSHIRETPSESWLITWEASTEGTGTYEGWAVRRESRATASIVVNYYADGTSEYYVNEYTATYILDAVDTGRCSRGGGYWKHWRSEVTDPARYDGIGPVTPNTVIPYKPTVWYNNRWTINTLELVLGGIGGYHLFEGYSCGGDWEREYVTDEYMPFNELMTSYSRSPFNSDDGPLFLYDVDAVFETTDFAVTYPVHLVERLRVELVTGRNLRVRDVEVTQGLQLHNSIPLVQGRRTIVRAYVDTGAEPGPVADVTARLRVYTGGTLLGELEPFNPAGAISAKRTPDWQQIDDTLNFELPWLWTQAPSLRFEVEVNHTRQVPELEYGDNTRSVELPLRDCELLKIGYLPVRFAPPGATPAGPDAGIAAAHEWMRKVYPVADDELIYWPVPGITWSRPIDDPDPDQTWANVVPLMNYLDDVLLLTHEPDVDRLVGWLPGSASQQLNGVANGVPGDVAFVTQKKAPRNLWRATLAHELGHTYGLNHTTDTTHGYHWFDVYERSIKPEMSFLGLADFMYDPNMLPEEFDWVSPASYTALYNKFCSGGGSASRAAEPQAATDVLLISGRVSLTSTQSAQLDPLFHVTGRERIPAPGSSYAVVLKNGDTELARYGFGASAHMYASRAYTPTVAPFLLSVPSPIGVNRIEVQDRYSNTLTSLVASAHPPTVTVLFPNAAGLALDGVQTIQWAGSDPDGDPLTYIVLYSKDNGVTWNPIGAGISDTSYAVDFSAIPGSSAALIKVLASDGFYTAGDVSDQPFAVPAKPPVAAIVSPHAGAILKAGELIKLQGYAVDLEEGLLAPESLSWSSDLDGPLGSGGLREVTLSAGTHTVTLDAGGGAAGATTTVVVQAPSPPAGTTRIYLPLVVR